MKKYEAIRKAKGEDGRVRGLTQYYGANRTGRWAGKARADAEPPRETYIGTLDEARKLVEQKNYEGLRLIYGNVPDTLSQLIRTAFIPSEGNKFVVADFSAIEARVIAWLAGEQWVNEVFATHGKIYEATASQMFHVPVEKIKKGNPEYSLRQKGKVATLALGYQGGTAALIAMGARGYGADGRRTSGYRGPVEGRQPEDLRPVVQGGAGSAYGNADSTAAGGERAGVFPGRRPAVWADLPDRAAAVREEAVLPEAVPAGKPVRETGTALLQHREQQEVGRGIHLRREND